MWTSRARHSDLMLLLARTTPVDEVKRRTDGLSVFLVDLRENLGHGVEIRPIEAMINHNTTEVFFDNLQCGELLLVVGYMARSNLTSLPGDPVPHDLVRAMISVNNSSVVRWRQ